MRVIIFSKLKIKGGRVVNNKKSVLYVDPSYKCTGLFLIQKDEAFPKEGEASFIFDRIKLPPFTKRNFQKYFFVAYNIKEAFLNKIFHFKQRYGLDEVFWEYPFVSFGKGGQASNGLWGLSFMLLSGLRERYADVPVRLIHTTFISSQHKKHGDGMSRSDKAWDTVQRMSETGRVQVLSDVKLIQDEDIATAFLFWYYQLGYGEEFSILPYEFSQIEGR